MTPSPLAAQRGNETRCGRAQFKRDLREGTAGAAELLARPELPAWARTWNIEAFIRCVPYMRPERRNRIIWGIPIKATATLGELTFHKRLLAAAEIAELESVRRIEREAFPVVDGGYR